VTIPAYVERDWERYREWMALCAKGDCRYRDLSASAAAPPVSFPDEESRPRCPGYRASLTMEHAQHVLRSSLCERHRAWWGRRQVWLQQQRVRDAAATKQTAKTPWQEG